MAASFDWSGVVNYAKRYQVAVPKTQYELPGVTQEIHLGVPVAVPPIWHAIVTARLSFAPDKLLLKRAQRRLTEAVQEIEDIYPLTPAGLLTQIAYGLALVMKNDDGTVPFVSRACDCGGLVSSRSIMPSALVGRQI